MLIDRINITYVGLAKPCKHTRKHKVTLLKLGCGPPHSLTVSSTWQGTEHIYWLVDVHMICAYIYIIIYIHIYIHIYIYIYIHIYIYIYIYKSPSTYTIGNPSTAAPKNVQILHHTTRCLDQEVFNSHTHRYTCIYIYIQYMCIHIRNYQGRGSKNIQPIEERPSPSSTIGLQSWPKGPWYSWRRVPGSTVLHPPSHRSPWQCSAWRGGRSLVGFSKGLLN